MALEAAPNTLPVLKKPLSLDGRTPADIEPDERVKFSGSSEFHGELRRRVDAYFRTSGRRPRDCPRMYLKTAIILSWFVATYVLLVFCVATWWQAIPVALLLGLSMAGIGFNIQHDGSHHAYSDRQWVNTLAAMSLDMIGVSSFVWYWTHNVIHHTYVNITGHDTDIDLEPIARLSPHQELRAYHRFQHWYIWPLYCIFTIKWHLFDDFSEVFSGRIGIHRIPRLGLRGRFAFFGGKIVSFTLTFGIPLLFHSPLKVFSFYIMVSCVLGFTLSVIFQLAHCVEEADFPLHQKHPSRIENAWAIHQVETTVNFSRHSRVASWFLGGLNFQIEHHLLPRVCHVNYPELAPLVEATCKEFGVRYAVHKSFAAGFVSHFRWLRKMGTQPNAAAPIEIQSVKAPLEVDDFALVSRPTSLPATELPT